MIQKSIAPWLKHRKYHYLINSRRRLSPSTTSKITIRRSFQKNIDQITSYSFNKRLVFRNLFELI